MAATAARELRSPAAAARGSIRSGANSMQERTMFDLASDIQSLSHFKRNTPAVLEQLRESGHPMVLTVNGKAEVVVQDAAAYQRLMDLARKAEMLEFLRQSREDIDAGRTEPAVAALERLAKKYKLKGKAS
jgi:prevent-host-death family protein